MSSFKKGMSHHSTSGMGSRRITFGSIFRTPMSASFCSSSFLSSFFSSFFPFFCCSFSLSMPSAFSCIFFTIRCSFFTSSPDSTNRKVFRRERSKRWADLNVGSKYDVSLPLPSLLKPSIFFSRDSFSRLMLTFKVLTTCGFMGTTLPSSSSSRPNSSRINFRAFGPSPGKKPAARPWVFSLAICSWICRWNIAARLAFSKASRAAEAAAERSMLPPAPGVGMPTPPRGMARGMPGKPMGAKARASGSTMTGGGKSGS
mmetsp:Transcript_59601/g.172630  ORF Transcript_59601/g.172630 Transcript_59601/m.172630 type:complete len:258 (-) Transcript_59601:293-1066(-)